MGRRKIGKRGEFPGGRVFLNDSSPTQLISHARQQSPSWLLPLSLLLCRNKGASESPSIQPPHFYIALSRLGSFQVGRISAMGHVVANGRAVSGAELSSHWLALSYYDAMWANVDETMPYRVSANGSCHRVNKK